MAALISMCSCGGSDQNPLLTEYGTPYGAPPFDKIKNEHYKPAFEEGIRQARAEVDAIVNNAEEPTFANTIEALERSGKLLNNVAGIFFNLTYAEVDDEMQQISMDVSPMLTEWSNDVSLNQKLFDRVKTVYDNRANLTLSTEQMRLLEKTYKGFARSGAALSEEDKVKYRAITKELSELSLKFDKNMLAATNAFTLHITDSAQLEGLPEFAISGAAVEAKERGLEGWVITLQYPSLSPFLTYSTNRELKEKIWRASSSKALGGEFDNTEIIKRIVELRYQLAQLLGYETYADYVLEERMAKNRNNVTELLTDLLEKSLPAARRDVEEIQEYAKSKGVDYELMPWDFSYWSEKYKTERYSIDDQMTKPYFKLENVEKGVFMLATKLYGLRFVENKEVPVYHKDVRVMEVYDGERLMGLLYVDYFPRAGKKSGAWMTLFRENSIDAQGNETRPLVSLVLNFTKPTENEPALLTFYEVTTLLHEFGHALHGLLAEGTYQSQVGTNVPRDFVELPSQLMENFAYEKEFLDMFAEHYQTGEKIPAELVTKIVAAKNFMSGYGSVRQISFGLADMAWHTRTSPIEVSVEEFEKTTTKDCQLLPSIKGTAMAPTFSHIFSGGYAAGYYGYKWSEVLDADAFTRFKEEGIFNQEVAKSFRENILSMGNRDDLMTLYVKFRGQEPSTEALLKRSGLVEK